MICATAVQNWLLVIDLLHVSDVKQLPKQLKAGAWNAETQAPVTVHSQLPTRPAFVPPLDLSWLDEHDGK